MYSSIYLPVNLSIYPSIHLTIYHRRLEQGAHFSHLITVPVACFHLMGCMHPLI